MGGWALVCCLFLVPVRAADVTTLERVVVSTATRTDRLLAEVPIRTEVLLREDLHLRAAVDFCQAVELLNGVRVESDCQNCNTTQVQLLGLGGAYNQILFDGAPLLSSLGGVYGLEQIPASLVDRIEVVKGGGSALYGPSAVAGVINLIPVPPRRTGGSIEAGVSLEEEPIHQVGARVDAVSAKGEVALSVGANTWWNDAIDRDGDGYSEITERELATAGVQVWAQVTPIGRLRVQYQYTWEDRRGGNRFDQPEHLANVAESLQTKYHRGGVIWDQTLGADADLRVEYSFAHIERDSFYGGLGDVVTDPTQPGFDPDELDPDRAGSAANTASQQYGYTRNPLHFADTQVTHRWSNHATTGGVQFKWESVQDENRTFRGERALTLADERFHTTGVFLQDEWQATQTLDTVLGVRADQSSELSRVIVSPRAAVTWRPGAHWAYRGGVSTGFRVPEIFSEDLHVTTLGAEPRRIRNAENLREERAWTVMTGVEWRSSADDPDWTSDVTFSRTELQDSFVLGPTEVDPAGVLFQRRSNAGGATVLGAEANVSHRLQRTLRATWGVAYYDPRYDKAQVVFDTTEEGGDRTVESRRFLKSPRLTSVAQMVWTPSGRWDVYVGAKHTARMRVLSNSRGELVRTPHFVVIDVGATHHQPIGDRHVDVSFGIKNLTDDRQRDWETGPNRDSEYVYGPRFGRMYYVSVKVEY